MTDGPFAESRAQHGGYRVSETSDLDAAIESVSQCSAICGGTVEVRPSVPAHPPRTSA